ncbi:FAD-dependent monooxygenase [Nocardia asiatica]|uniref:FAD-dependent monooxygenase n=1 Tax=Nocardia asiatica TaxID=209252 RepID=UPI0012FBC51E|nr:FAD-dependent monooxygenase [Nocardia asiatica]
MYISKLRGLVVIVGAGPSGLTLAFQLARLGIRCRIIDKRKAPSDKSKSFTLQARTLELFDMAGIAHLFEERGIPSDSMDWHFSGYQDVARLDYTTLQSRYPFVLIIPQNDTETVLRDHLASLDTHVEWETELVSAKNDDDGLVTARLVHTDTGREEIVRPDWLVGCDGLQSRVREQLGVSYVGDEYSGQAMKMMNGPVSGLEDYDSNRIHYFIKESNMLLVTALPDGNCRVLISENSEVDSAEMTLAAFQSVVDDHFPHRRVTLGAQAENSVFSIWRRISGTYRIGRILLCGDANHINSPAGGQGMNCGIQDAFNLGWKLGMVVRGYADEAVLETYELERRPVAELVLAGSHELTKILMDHGTPIPERIAKTREPGFNERMVGLISGLSFSYRDVISTPAGLTGPADLAVGDRVPLHLHEFLRHPFYTVAALERRDPQAAAANAALKTRLERRFGERVKFASVPASSLGGRALSGACGEAADRSHDADTAVALIRPDGHFGALGSTSEQAALFDALDAVLTPA